MRSQSTSFRRRFAAAGAVRGSTCGTGRTAIVGSRQSTDGGVRQRSPRTAPRLEGRAVFVLCAEPTAGGDLVTANGLKVADSDMHVLEPPDLWQRYIDPAYKH